MSALTHGSATDVGRVRKQNQDSFSVLSSEELQKRADGLYALADGMGGRAGGEVASQVAVATLCEVVSDLLEDSQTDGPDAQLSAVLSDGMRAANRAVWKQSRANPELRGMGTTCVAVLVRGDRAAIGNLGDSRVYLLRGGALTQLTSDHSLVQEHVLAGELSQAEARASRYRNVITRAVGITDEVNPDVDVIKLAEGDTVLLCSDGLTNMVTDYDIATVLAKTGETQEAAERLVEIANGAGGKDNITAVVVRYGKFAPSAVATRDEPVQDDRITAPYDLPAKDRPGKIGGFLPLVLLVIGLTILALVIVTQVSTQQGKPSGAPRDATPRVLDFSHFVYSSPSPLTNKKLRSEPLLCDAAGNSYALSVLGRMVRITPGGEVTPCNFTPPITQNPPQTDVHWATDAQGNVYMSSRKTARISKFAPTGARTAELPVNGALVAPAAIAIDGKGNIYVIDDGILKRLLVTGVQIPERGGPDASR